MSHCNRCPQGPAPERRRALVQMASALALALVVIACESPARPTPSPAPPPAPPLVVTCPPAMEAESIDGQPVAVEFNPPQASGGVAPITTTCTATSGASFGVGSTNVTCSVVDARGTAASCGFQVTVRQPRLAYTRFLAFGDSITAGADSPPVPGAAIIVSPYAYPLLLEPLLRSRYRLQSPVVLGEGIPGEKASDTGIARFREVVRRFGPEVVILMEGTNDLLDFHLGVERGADALRQMVQQAQQENVRVLLSTILPQRAGGARMPPRDPYAALVPLLNDRIRAIAQAENVPLVDTHAVFHNDMSLIGIDDVHPTPRGYEIMAQTFFEAIRTHFEATGPSAARVR